jgi:hypothetical protein
VGAEELRGIKDSVAGVQEGIEMLNRSSERDKGWGIKVRR